VLQLSHEPTHASDGQPYFLEFICVMRYGAHREEPSWNHIKTPLTGPHPQVVDYLIITAGVRELVGVIIAGS
jgi:hypothetical protein